MQKAITKFIAVISLIAVIFILGMTAERKQIESRLRDNLKKSLQNDMLIQKVIYNK